MAKAYRLASFVTSLSQFNKQANVVVAANTEASFTAVTVVSVRACCCLRFFL